MTTNLCYDVAALGPLVELGRGGQGVVYGLPRFAVRNMPPLVYKQYLPGVWPDENPLRRMVAHLTGLPDVRARQLVDRTAWPVALVTDSAAVIGFLMPAIPPNFHVTMSMRTQSATTLATMQHLLNTSTWLSARGLRMTDETRAELLRDVAETMATLHRENITIGDFSARNVLFDILAPAPRSFLIDCDSMCLNGDFVLPPVETPDWDVAQVSREMLATRQSDSYKLALLATRLFTDDLIAQITRSADDATRLPALLRPLVERGLAPTPGQRPEPAEWCHVLDAYLASPVHLRGVAGGSAVPAQPPVPPTPRPAPPAVPGVAVPGGAMVPPMAPQPVAPVPVPPGGAGPRRAPWVVALAAAAGVLGILLLGPLMSSESSTAEPRESRAAQGSATDAPTTGSAPSPPGGSPRWVAQIASIPVANEARRDKLLASLRATDPSIDYVRSADYASLRGGYWMVFSPGPFETGGDALAFCLRHGWRTANECQGRVLSDDATHYLTVCALDANGRPGRNCERRV